MAAGLLLVGVVLVVAGLAWLSVPVAVVAVGVFCVLSGIDLARGDR